MLSEKALSIVNKGKVIVDRCPFCGDYPTRLFSYEMKKYYVACQNPKCLIQPMTPAYKNKGSDLKAWNKRFK